MSGFPSSNSGRQWSLDLGTHVSRLFHTAETTLRLHGLQRKRQKSGAAHDLTLQVGAADFWIWEDVAGYGIFIGALWEVHGNPFLSKVPLHLDRLRVVI